MIRRMTEADIHEVAMLEKSVFTDPWSENVYRETYKIPGVIYVVAVEDDKIVGAAGIRNIVGDGEITNVMVDVKYRGRGIAHEILEKLICEAEKAGVIDCTLEVRAGNHNAIKLYKDFGFVSEGIRPGFYKHPDEDALIMWKRKTETI